MQFTVGRMADGYAAPATDGARCARRDAAAAGGFVVRVVIFCHSLLSDWNHGNAHFLRGVVAELVARGHDVRVYEPRDGVERANLIERARARRRSRPSREPTPASPARALRPGTLDLDARSTAPTSCSCTSGTTTRWSPRSARTARARRGLPPALPRHPPPRGHRPGGDRRATTSPTTTASSRSATSIRDVYLERGWARAGLDLARGGRHPRLPPAPASAGGRRPRLDRQLGRRGARRAELQRVPDRAGRALGLRRASTASAIPTTARARARARRASSTAAGCRTTTCPGCSRASASRCTCRAGRTSTALPGHSDHPPVRGARVRHPARLGAVATTPRGCSRPARTSSSPRRRGDDHGSSRACSAIPTAARSWRDHGRRTVLGRHTCAPPRRRAARRSWRADGAAPPEQPSTLPQLTQSELSQ